MVAGRIHRNSGGTLLRQKIAHDYTPLQGLCMMLLVLIASPCAATVAVTIPDASRPCPSAVILAQVLEELGHAGVPDGGVSVHIGCGLHATTTPEERADLAGASTAARVAVVDAQGIETECADLGTTPAGVPARIARRPEVGSPRACSTRRNRRARRVVVQGEPSATSGTLGYPRPDPQPGPRIIASGHRQVPSCSLVLAS